MCFNYAINIRLKTWESNYLNEDYIKQLSIKIGLEIQKEVVFYLTNKHDNSGLLVFEQELVDDRVQIL
jgi:hypothetical protein